MTEEIVYVFTKKDIMKKFAENSQYENWIARLLHAKKAVRVRNGLYTYVDVYGYPLSTKFEIASKISEDAVVCYHSALEYYGLSNQVFNTVIVGSSLRFNNFSYNGIDYVHRPVKHYEQINQIVSTGVRVTTLERTIIDCIDNINLAGGIDELLNALDMIKLLDESKLLEILQSYNSVYLYQKTGYILEQFQHKFLFTDMFYDKCKSCLTNQVKYFLQDEYCDIKYNSRWKLMAPINIKSRIDRGTDGIF